MQGPWPSLQDPCVGAELNVCGSHGLDLWVLCLLMALGFCEVSPLCRPTSLSV